MYAVSVQARPGNPLMSGRVPYAVALVELPEGVRLMAEIDTDDPWSVRVGDKVKASWEPLSDGRRLLCFRPATTGEG